jgi:hypothetical protein
MHDDGGNALSLELFCALAKATPAAEAVIRAVRYRTSHNAHAVCTRATTPRPRARARSRGRALSCALRAFGASWLACDGITLEFVIYILHSEGEGEGGGEVEKAEKAKKGRKRGRGRGGRARDFFFRYSLFFA